MKEIVGFEFKDRKMIPIEKKEGVTPFWDEANSFTCRECGKRNNVRVPPGSYGFLKCGFCGADPGICVC